MDAVRYEDSTQGVAFSDSMGKLECLRDNDTWCPHIQEAIRSGLDAQGIWLWDHDAHGLQTRRLDIGGMDIEVPLIPSHQVFAWVRLGHKAGTGFVVNLNHGEIKDEFLGILAPDEGRLSIRSMIYDWLRTAVDLSSVPRCYGAAHGLIRQKSLEARLLSGVSGKIAEHYSVLSTKMCVDCQFVVTVPDQPVAVPTSFDPDLIPD